MNLEDLLPLIEIMARERTRSRPNDYDDAVQEGLIAAWTALEKNPGQSDQYYAGAARMGIVGFVTDEHRPTGAPSRRGGGRKTGEMEFVPIADWDSALPEVQTDIDARTAVRRRLAEKERQIVFMRIWKDMTFKQIGERLGLKESSTAQRWKTHIVPRLLGALAES